MASYHLRNARLLLIICLVAVFAYVGSAEDVKAEPRGISSLEELGERLQVRILDNPIYVTIYTGHDEMIFFYLILSDLFFFRHVPLSKSSTLRSSRAHPILRMLSPACSPSSSPVAPPSMLSSQLSISRAHPTSC